MTGEFFGGIVTAIPNVGLGILLLVFAYVTIKTILAVVRGLLSRIYPERQMLIINLQVVVVGLFLWFGAALALLKIVGLEEVAASLGTAVGVIGLGIPFTLKEMIADTVAGGYLLRDPHLNIGDTTNTASVSGTIRRIDLGKTRIEADNGDLVVLANHDVEKEWVQTSRGDGASAD